MFLCLLRSNCKLGSDQFCVFSLPSLYIPAETESQHLCVFLISWANNAAEALLLHVQDLNLETVQALFLFL